jgi:hypothetical protein
VTFNLQQLLFEEPEDPENAEAVFGKYVFDWSRPEIPFDDRERETKEELDLKYALQQYFVDNEQDDLQNHADTVYGLAKKNLYARILTPGEITVYRTLSMKLPGASKLLKVSVKDLHDLQKPGRLTDFVLTPRLSRSIQGWTTKTSVAKDFANFVSHEVVVSFKTTTSNGKFFGVPGMLAKASGNLEYVSERETLSYGPVKCEEVRFLSKYAPSADEYIEYLCFMTDEVPTP